MRRMPPKSCVLNRRNTTDTQHTQAHTHTHQQKPPARPAPPDLRTTSLHQSLYASSSVADAGAVSGRTSYYSAAGDDEEQEGDVGGKGEEEEEEANSNGGSVRGESFALAFAQTRSAAPTSGSPGVAQSHPYRALLSAGERNASHVQGGATQSLYVAPPAPISRTLPAYPGEHINSRTHSPSPSITSVPGYHHPTAAATANTPPQQQGGGVSPLGSRPDSGEDIHRGEDGTGETFGHESDAAGYASAYPVRGRTSYKSPTIPAEVHSRTSYMSQPHYPTTHSPSHNSGYPTTTAISPSPPFFSSNNAVGRVGGGGGSSAAKTQRWRAPPTMSASVSLSGGSSRLEQSRQQQHSISSPQPSQQQQGDNGQELGLQHYRAQTYPSAPSQQRREEGGPPQPHVAKTQPSQQQQDPQVHGPGGNEWFQDCRAQTYPSAPSQQRGGEGGSPQPHVAKYSMSHSVVMPSNAYTYCVERAAESGRGGETGESPHAVESAKGSSQYSRGVHPHRQRQQQQTFSARTETTPPPPPWRGGGNDGFAGVEGRASGEAADMWASQRMYQRKVEAHLGLLSNVWV